MTRPHTTHPTCRASVAALALLLPLLAACAVAGRRCENTELLRRPAPDGAYDAVLFGRTCDEQATSTNLSVVFEGARVSEDIGNLFQAAGAPDTTALSVAWAGARRLVVRYPAELTVLKRDTTFREVRVRYEAARLSGG